MKKLLCLLLISCFVLSGCVSQADYDAKVSEISELETTIEEQQTEIKTLSDELSKLKEAPEYLYSEAVKKVDSKHYLEAKNLLEDILKRYPSCELTENVNTKLEETNILIEEQVIAVAAQKEALEAQYKPPLETVSARVQYNSIGNPEASVTVKNITDRTIDAYTVDIECFDNFDKPVNHYLYDTNVFGGISQNTIYPGGTFGQYSYWTLHGHDNTTNVKVSISEVHFEDGETWEVTPGHEVYITGEDNK